MHQFQKALGSAARQLMGFRKPLAALKHFNRLTSPGTWKARDRAETPSWVSGVLLSWLTADDSFKNAPSGLYPLVLGINGAGVSSTGDGSVVTADSPYLSEERQESFGCYRRIFHMLVLPGVLLPFKWIPH